MKSGMRDQVEGTMKDIKGAGKQGLGKATGNPARRASGTVDRVAGKLQKKTGQIKMDRLRD